MPESRWEKALKEFEEADRLTPGREAIKRAKADAGKKLAGELFAKGQKLYTGKDLPGAIRLWEDASQLDSGNSEIAQRLDAAREELQDANRAKADDYNRRGLKEYGLGNLDAAIELWEKALELDPENEKIRNNLNRAKQERKK